MLKKRRVATPPDPVGLLPAARGTEGQKRLPVSEEI